jgi:hypothetical protein
MDGDELVHQALKDPLAERMPFEDFLPNVAFYSGGAQGLQSLGGVQRICAPSSGMCSARLR